MVGAIERARAGWRGGETRDVHADMMGVTLDIVAETLFGADVSAAAGDIGHIIGDLMEQFGRVLGLSARFQPPMWVPTPANRRLRKTSRRIDTLIQGIIDARKRSQETRDDLLSLLIRARDEAGGADDRRAGARRGGHPVPGRPRDDGAGADVRAVPAGDASRVRRRASADEIERVLGGRSPGLADLDKLDRHRDGRARVDAPLSARVGHRPAGAGARRDRRLRVPEGRRVRDVAVGRAPRRAQLRGARGVQARALGGRSASAASRASPTFRSAAARASASATASR